MTESKDTPTSVELPQPHRDQNPAQETPNSTNNNITLPDVLQISDKMSPQALSSMPTGPRSNLFGDLKARGFELREFTLFPELCAELRIQIWRLTMPRPRLVEVTYLHGIYHLKNLARTEKAPTLFFVCHEERVEVIKLYKPLKNIDGIGATW